MTLLLDFKEIISLKLRHYLKLHFLGDQIVEIHYYPSVFGRIYEGGEDVASSVASGRAGCSTVTCLQSI